MKKQKLFELVGLVVLISFILWAIITRMRNQHELLSNGVIVNARIVGIATGGKGGGASFICEFSYGGKQYKEFSPTTYKGNCYSLIGKFFPAMFAPTTETLEILITNKDFDKFEIPYPDSLRLLTHQ